MQYNYEIQYKKSKVNTVANALSRVSEMKFNNLTTTLLPLELLHKIE